MSEALELFKKQRATAFYDTICTEGKYTGSNGETMAYICTVPDPEVIIAFMDAWEAKRDLFGL